MSRPTLHVADRTPARAVLTSAVLAYLFNWILEQSSSSPAQGFSDVTGLGVSTCFANLSHAIQLASLLKLRYSMNSLDRPCSSPAGEPGAVIALVIVVIVGILAPFGLVNRKPCGWSVILFAVSCTIFLVYFQLVAKPRLVANAAERLFIRSILDQRFAPSAGNNDARDAVDSRTARELEGPGSPELFKLGAFDLNHNQE
ncbi:hypothetical protein BCR44DRAFT_1460151 [Catenaria anguillulae PL171]|uniref:Amino acid permease/ SLC12A domain-containing protein n=1 Tax=Catenaria anguillulae PL171 TaxID=765915 RepID=A0A1Y2HUE6_9FUNG|nr:hypothetical protein BCR44DRAFT_1460151 [Catenaria anguillulae PL171]